MVWRISKQQTVLTLNEPRKNNLAQWYYFLLDLFLVWYELVSHSQTLA